MDILSNMIEWTLESRKLKDLKEHPKNPRILTSEQGFQLQKSLERFGIVEKLIINTDNCVIGGHQRLKILKKMGVKEVECWVPNRTLDDGEVDELCIRLNRNHGLFDYEKLANEWDLPDLLDWGFTIDELDLGSEKEEKEKKDKPPKLCPHCGENIDA